MSERFHNSAQKLAELLQRTDISKNFFKNVSGICSSGISA